MTLVKPKPIVREPPEYPRAASVDPRPMASVVLNRFSGLKGALSVRVNVPTPLPDIIMFENHQYVPDAKRSKVYRDARVWPVIGALDL